MWSSHCPSGCRYDRHSEDESRFIRIREDGEGVIFSADGAGAVTRIWMVMGDDVSEPLDPNIRLRVRLDGSHQPVVDLPLPEVFSGDTPPFLPPLVADRAASGGGQVSYVPISFRNGCEITLVGSENAKIWFQVVARLVDDDSGIRSFTGKENLDAFKNLLQRSGSDPWPGGNGLTMSGSAMMAPGDEKVIATLDGPDLVNGLIIRAANKNWHRLGLRFTFDGGEPQLIPVLDLFGIPNVFGGLTRSLLVGVDGESDLYCYFPMPFFENAKVELMRRPLEGPPRVRVEYALRTAGEPPPPDAGIFRVQIRHHKASSPGTDLKVLDLEGRGSLVGLVAQLRPSAGKDWGFLEGDERIYVDGEDEPSWHGTGVEDLFNGGFYFRDETGTPAQFTTALAGAPYLLEKPPWAVMYRLFLSDSIGFRRGIRAEFETGPTGNLSVFGHTVAYYYQRSDDSMGR